MYLLKAYFVYSVLSRFLTSIFEIQFFVCRKYFKKFKNISNEIINYQQISLISNCFEKF